MIFYSIDGDDVGRRLERLILEEKIDEVKDFSNLVKTHIEFLAEFMINNGANVIFCTGDGLMANSEKNIELTSLIHSNKELTFSIGIGNSPSNALLALKKAKGLGKQRIEIQISEKP